MAASFQDELTRLANPAVAASIAISTASLAGSLAEILATRSRQDAEALLTLFVRTVAAEIEAINRATPLLPNSTDATTPPVSEKQPVNPPVPPEVVRQALLDFDEKETVEAIRQLRATGGLVLQDFYADLEKLTRNPE